MEKEQLFTMARLEDEHWWFVARRKIVNRVLASLKLPAGAEILEAGCGTGGNLKMLSAYGRVRGMELDDDARRLAVGRGQAEIVAGKLPNEIPFEGVAFDLIALFDVLEHVEEDSASLKALLQRLKPGGWLVLTVPACPFLWSKHDEVHHHKRRYMKKSLRSVVLGAGFKECYTTYFNSILFPVVAGVRGLKSLARSKGGDGDVRMPSRWVNRTLATVFASERLALGRRIPLPIGVSLMMVAQRA